MIFNISEFDRIPGVDALRFMLDGGSIFDNLGNERKLNNVGLMIVKTSDGKWAESNAKLNYVTGSSWLKKKPFQVREAMLKEPGNWVGRVVLPGTGRIMKVGLDYKHFAPVMVPIGINVAVNIDARCAEEATDSILDLCTELTC